MAARAPHNSDTPGDSQSLVSAIHANVGDEGLLAEENLESGDVELIAAVLAGRPECFEPLIVRYQSRVFRLVRRYARRETDVEDLAQEVFIRAYHKLKTFRGTAPFEHWLMRLAVRVCYDYLRNHQRRRETSWADLGEVEQQWLERYAADPRTTEETDNGARELAQRLLSLLSPASRLVLTLQEIEERPVKEIAQITGWSVPLVKVRAFRARREMRKHLEKLARKNQL